MNGRLRFHSTNVFQGVPYGPEVAMRYRVKFGQVSAPATGWGEALDVASVLSGIDRDEIEDEGAWVADGLFVGGFGHREFSIEEDQD